MLLTIDEVQGWSDDKLITEFKSYVQCDYLCIPPIDSTGINRKNISTIENELRHRLESGKKR